MQISNDQTLVILYIQPVLCYYIFAMLKGAENKELEYLQKPRKLIKINVREDASYDEFKGDFIEGHAQGSFKRETKVEPEVRFANEEEEANRNKNIFELIKSNATGHIKIRRLEDASTKPKPQISNPPVDTKTEKETPKPDEKAQISTNISQLPKKVKKVTSGLSNWQSFLANSTPAANQSKGKESKSKESKSNAQFIAIDCEFVKSGDEQLLARVSLINEMGDCLLDTYVHPDKKITDYVTDISGITFGHIRHAPSTKTVIENVKSILYNKIVVGHTVWKDLEVCGLKEWKGWKAVVDICEFPSFKEKSGKLISLKNLSAKFLGKKIQEGRHSSTEDAQATMNLFLMKKKQILKQYKLIK